MCVWVCVCVLPIGFVDPSFITFLERHIPLKDLTSKQHPDFIVHHDKGPLMNKVRCVLRCPLSSCIWVVMCTPLLPVLQRVLPPRLSAVSLFKCGWYGPIAVKAASAFLVMGSTAVVTALWKVDDVPTTLFFLRFYGEIARQTDLLCRPVPAIPGGSSATAKAAKATTAANIDMAEALNVAQRWLSKVSVLEASRLLRDFGYRTLANDVERVFGARGMCVCGGYPPLYGRPTCHCAPFGDPVYWAGFVILGATECVKQFKHVELPPLRLFPPPPKEQSEDKQEDVTGLPDDKTAIVGTISIMRA